MKTQIVFFPVDNGDMTLITLKGGQTILTDCNIRKDADDDNQPDIPDVVTMLKDHLCTDEQDRLYVDVFLLTHPDEDHCRGLERHFHLGKPEDYDPESNKILIHELWSSAIVFRRKHRDHPDLCSDAQAFQKEVKRRIKRFKEGNEADSGNRVQIMGEDIAGKTEGLEDILINLDETITTINGQACSSFSARLLCPLPPSEDEDREEALAKNRSSVILMIEFTVGQDNYRFLMGGDAEVNIWERLWEKYEDTPDVLEYDLLLAPHHCSWHTLSKESVKEKQKQGEEPKASPAAILALSQTRQGAQIIASCKAISDEDTDPPSPLAKAEYLKILGGNTEQFHCLAEYPSADSPDQLQIKITQGGLQLQHASVVTHCANVITHSQSGRKPVRHG